MDKGKNRNDLIAAGRKKLQQYRKKKDQKGGASEHHGRSSNTATKQANADTGRGHQDPLPDMESASATSVVPPADVDMEIGDSTALPVTALLENLAVSGSSVSSDSVSLDLAHSLLVTEANGEVQENRDPSNESWGVPSPSLLGEKESAMEPDKEANYLGLDGWKGGGKTVLEPSPTVENNASYVAQLQTDESACNLMVEDKVKIEDSRVGLVPEEAATTICAEPDAVCRDVGIESDLSTSLSTSESVNEQCGNILLLSVHSGVNTAAVDENSASTSTQGMGSFLVQFEANQEEVGDPCPSATGNLTAISMTENEMEIRSSLPDHFSDDCHRMKEDTETNVKSGGGSCLLSTHSLNEETCSAHMQIPIGYTGSSHAISNQEQTILFTVKGTTLTSPDTVDASVRDLQPTTTNFESRSEPDLSEASLILPPNCLEGQTDDENSILMKWDEFGRVTFSNVVEDVENLKMHLYLTTFTNNVLHMQHDEEIKAKSDIILSLSNEVSRLRDSLASCQRSNVGNYQELVDCRVQLQTVISEKEVTEGHLISARKEIDVINNQVHELQNKIKVFQENSTVLSVELLNCKVLLEDLQIENAKLNQNINFISKEKQILVHDKDYLAIENSKLASDILIQKDQLIAAFNKQKQLEIDIEEYLAPVEELSKENLSLSVCLDAYRMKLRDLDCVHISLPQETEARHEREIRNTQARDAVDAALKPCTSDIDPDSYCAPRDQQHYYDLSKQAEFCQQVGTEDAVMHPSETGYSGQESVTDNIDNASVLYSLKRHLLEVTGVTQKLEQAIQGLHSQTVSLRKSRSASSGVSKLIQAFESKVPADDTDETDRITEDKSTDALILTKHHIVELKAVLELMDITVEKMESMFKEELDHKIREEKLILEYEAQKSLNGKLEQNLGKVVSYLSSYKQELDVLQNQLEDISTSVFSDTEGMVNQLELLQGEILESLHIIQNEQKSTRNANFESIKVLNASTGLLVSDELDLNSRVQASVHAAIETIEVLNKGLARLKVDYNIKYTDYEELLKEFKKMQGEREIATRTLLKVCSSIREILDGTCEEQVERKSNIESGEPLEMMQKDTEHILEQLKVLLDERILILSAKAELEMELQNRTLNIQELRARCDFLSNSLEDESHAKDKLEKSLMDFHKYIDGLNGRCIVLAKKIEKFKGSNFTDESNFSGVACNSEEVHTEGSHSDFIHILCLESWVDFLLKSHEKILEEVSLSKHHLKEVNSLFLISAEQFLMPLHFLMHEVVIPKIMEMREAQEKFHHQSSLMLEKENEIQVLKDIMVKMDEDLKVSRSDYDAKVVELEQSEQRLSSVREKLSIAVAKGKGLIVQRDNLKQSLVDKSGELEKCLQELQTKENLLHDLEAKLKSYSEVDRVEALESELSYIRNSATAFRDSFLLKDSILQRIEEVLEDLDLPENFHAKDTVEKIELLARSAISNSSLLSDDWKQKRDTEGVHADAGYAVVDSWQEQVPPSSTSDLDELSRSFEDLQHRFYGLAEHNEILEQSLVERNNLMQRCEENLDKIDMPSYLRSMEPDVRIEWLAKSMGEVKLERDSLFAKVENLDEANESLLANLEEQQKKATELELEVTAVKLERGSLSSSLDKLRSEYLAISAKEAQDEIEKVQLWNDISDLQKKNAEKDRSYNGALDAVKKLQDLVSDALPGCHENASFSGECHIEYVEGFLKKLIDHYKPLSEKVVLEAKELTTDESKEDSELKKLKDLLDEKDRDLVALRSQLSEASDALDRVKEEKEATRESYHSLCLEMEEIIKQKNALLGERDATTGKYQVLLSELDALKKEKCALVDQLNQEETKCGSMKEKLNVAVRKGKGLVQQRDSLKQNIEEVTRNLDQVQSELNNRVAENLSMKNQLTENESRLQNLTVTLNDFLSVLHAIDVGGVTSTDPAQKLKEIAKLACDWRTAAISSDNEAVKSRKAAELLVAELNEVQERVDNLQEELSKVEAELDQCYRLKAIAESANAESQSQLELLVSAHSEERRKEAANVLKLMASINELRKNYSALLSFIYVKHNLHATIFCNLEASAKSILKNVNHDVYSQDAFSGSTTTTITFRDASDKEAHLDVGSSDMNFRQDFHHNHVDHFSTAWQSLGHCLEELDILKDKIQENSSVIEQAGRHLMELMEFIQKEVTSQKASSESIKSEMTRLVEEMDERETEIILMQKNLALLFEACRSAVLEIQSRKSKGSEEAKLLGLVPPHGMEFPISMSNNQDSEGQISRRAISFTEDTKTVVAALLAAVKSSGSIEEEIAEANERELKSLISELQQELQEKDIQRNRIYEELVSQINAAESIARKYKEDLDFAKMKAQNLEDQLQMMKEENESQKLRIKELTDSEVSSKDLQQKINQLTESSAAKDQEIEGLMQALDEDEAQMNSLGIRNQELEKLLQEKNHALQSLESSRAKAMVKLSNTISKFDELHQLSESLLAEIENLQLQLQEKESEISFLRHEVTRCTDDVLSEQKHNKKKTKEIFELRQAILTILSRVGILDQSMVSPNDSEIQDYTQFIEKQLSSIMAELNDLRVISQKKESLLQTEKAKVEALTKKEQLLENSLRERDTQIELFQRVKESGLASTSHLGETVDQLRNSTITPSTIVPQFRSGRKVNNDQIAIGIDLEQDSTVEDEDDDKAHGFKSLTMSRIIPKATRPVADKIDGLWVSIERLLMRQPTLRLGLILYWIALHAMLAATI